MCIRCSRRSVCDAVHSGRNVGVMPRLLSFFETLVTLWQTRPYHIPPDRLLTVQKRTGSTFILWNSVPFATEHAFEQFVLLERPSRSWRWEWSIGGMLMAVTTEELREKLDPAQLGPLKVSWKPQPISPCLHLTVGQSVAVQWEALQLLLLLFFNLFSPFSFRWRSTGKSISQQEIKAISPSTYRMLCAVLISVTHWWPGSNWRFWSNPFLVVPNAAIITGTIFVLTFHICRSLYLLSFSVSFC